MRSSLSKPGLPGPTGDHVAVGARGARTGLGYGILEPKFQLPRSLNSAYPYDDHDPYEMEVEDVEVSDDSVAAVGKKSLDYSPVDHFAAAGTDPFYFVAGNTKLSDCFSRQEKVLAEIAAFGDSMAAIPQLNQRRGPSATGYTTAFAYPGGGGSNFRRTGSFRGWSKSPPPLKAELEDEFPDEEDIYTLSDLVKKRQIE
jgi:hypothetical protein